MARLTERLTDLAIRKAKPNQDRNRVLPDGAGLRVVITPTGTKHFEFKSAVGGKERTARLGQYPNMSLDAARQEAGRLRQLSKSGINPVAEKQIERIRNRVSAGNTFEKVAEELLAGKKKNCSESYFKRMHSAIKANLYPMLGNLPVQRIDAPILLESLRRIEVRGALDMLTDVRRWASEIFDYAKAHGQYTGDNPADALLRNVFEKHKGSNMRTIDWSEVPAFWDGLNTLTADPATVAAVRLVVLTASRPGEVRAAQWKEFDFENRRWNVPAERMKMKKPHSVPLSKQAMEVLTNLQVLTHHSAYLFPSRFKGTKSPVISDMGILKAVKKASGKDIHAHGFRALFSTHVAESGMWPDSVKEAALAHSKRGVEGVYDRATHYAERVKLMQWYADEIDRAVQGAEVIPIRKTAA
jgi:integrase